MSEGRKAREIDLGNDFGDVVVKANGAAIAINADGSIYSFPVPTNDAASRSAREIGAVERAGDHKSKTYGGRIDLAYPWAKQVLEPDPDWGHRVAQGSREGPPVLSRDASGINSDLAAAWAKQLSEPDANISKLRAWGQRRIQCSNEESPDLSRPEMNWI